MSDRKKTPRIPLFSERKVPQNIDSYIYGSDSADNKETDTFADALSRYLSDSGVNSKKVSARKLCIISGVSKSAVYYYLLGERRISCMPLLLINAFLARHLITVIFVLLKWKRFMVILNTLMNRIVE